MLFEFLQEYYDLGEPIFISDITITDMTSKHLRYHYKKMTDDGMVFQFEPGVYYFPKLNIIGEKSSLSAETAALHKYIMRKGKRIGYYSGHTLANRLGLSLQVPLVRETTSNIAPADVREIIVGNILLEDHIQKEMKRM